MEKKEKRKKKRRLWDCLLFKFVLVLELEWATLDCYPERLFKSCHGDIQCGGQWT